ncbi:MAG: DUF423 domain-containing protein [Oleiphilaceae bacterium]|nr:DUF423 domain-containing protein [Oleiphilaceae bacterium]
MSEFIVNVERRARLARWALVIAALAGMLAVMLGAFGAHGLRSSLSPKMMQVYLTAVEYQFIHSLFLLAMGALLASTCQLAWRWAVCAVYAASFGLLVFCGSLYALVMSGVSALGMITPLGGLAFIVAWFSLALSVWLGRQSDRNLSE